MILNKNCLKKIFFIIKRLLKSCQNIKEISIILKFNNLTAK